MKTPVTAGDLRDRVSIEAASRTSDGGGGASVTWVKVAEAWAAVRPVSGSESFIADRLEGRITHDIWLRYRPGLDPGMRMTLGPRVFDLFAVFDPDGRQRWLHCQAGERDL